ncbi:hypothetical protein KRR26_23725 [Corallococcus sp. M34]|uniref:hypothetical protein n=1 Tax=Citreicoccus inhibens TaxID=2849499 RepID=UPI001C23020E|nr:hypothetical protein [Citreicoccus inhibens]MBU8898624.1 hypothetical protein [Citreicoccus inhibens]
MSSHPIDPVERERRLARLAAALNREQASPPPAQQDSGPNVPVIAGCVTLAVGLITVAISTGDWAWVIPALILGVFAGIAALGRSSNLITSNLPAGLVPTDPTQARIGMGAEVAEDAVVEPGATVEMGATIGPGAVIRSGAVVRMGSTVLDGALVEEGAIVSWGSTVHEDAVVGRGSVVGAGSTVTEGAHVPPGQHLMPGSTWATRTSPPAMSSSSPPPRATEPTRGAEVDPRQVRLDGICDRLEAELRQSSPDLRAAMGVSESTVTALRQMCHRVLSREKLLRAEAAPETMSLLEQEKAELERKRDAASDAAVQRSLGSAVQAISEQQRHRALLQKSADRLDAELTRLQWTLDGMSTQLVRLRSAGLEATSPDANTLDGLQQLYGEIDAIAEGLEEVAKVDQQVHGFEPIADIGSESSPAPASRTRTR